MHPGRILDALEHLARWTDEGDLAAAIVDRVRRIAEPADASRRNDLRVVAPANGNLPAKGFAVGIERLELAVAVAAHHGNAAVLRDGNDRIAGLAEPPEL